MKIYNIEFEEKEKGDIFRGVIYAQDWMEVRKLIKSCYPRYIPKTLKNIDTASVKPRVLSIHRHRQKILGYRAVLSGDERDYGCVDEFLIGEMRNGSIVLSEADAKERAEESVADNHGNGGSVKTLYHDTPEQGTVY